MQRIDDLIARVRRFVAEETPSLRDGGAVLAVSGGGDSMAMASLLIGAGIVRPAASVVAHFDHRSRGQAAAAADRAVVAALCARYGIEMVAGAWETPRRGEAAARDARYRFLVGVARDRGIGVIATAHTADDQVETLVMCEMRGAGVYGMRGIAAERMVVVGGGDVGCWGLDVGGERRGGDDGGWTMGDGGRSAGEPREAPIRVVRPVLGVTGGELRAWCVERGLAYVDDASNADLRYLRNRVRHEVLPRMEVDEPGVRARMIAQAADARTRVAEFDAGALLCRLPADAAIKQAHAVLDRAVLRAMPDAAAVHAYRVALTEVLGDVREFGRGHYETMVRAASGATGSTYEMPRGVVVTVDAGEVIVSVGALVLTAIGVDEVHALPWSGVIGAWWVEVRIGSGSASGCSTAGLHRRGDSANGDSATGGCDPATRAVDSARDAGGAVVRGRGAGDRVRLRGRGTKKLSDVYVDAKVPRRERDAAPVIAVGGVVVWSPLVEGKWLEGGCGDLVVTARRA